MQFVPLLVIPALIKKIVDTVKYGMAGDVNGVITQLTAWVAGVCTSLALAASDFGAAFEINGTTLGMMNAWSQGLVGLHLASVAGVGWDLIKAIDNTNSAVVPNMLTRTRAPQGVPGVSAPVREP